METKTLLGELAKVCETGNLTYAQKICGLYNNLDIRGQDDLLIKTICMSKQFHMLEWLLDLGKKTDNPYDLDSLLSELISTMDEETLDIFFDCITTYSKKNEPQLPENKPEIISDNIQDLNQIKNKKLVMVELLKRNVTKLNKKVLLAELNVNAAKQKLLLAELNEKITNQQEKTNLIDNSDQGRFLLFSSGKQKLKDILSNMGGLHLRSFINFALMEFYGSNDEMTKKIAEIFKGYINGCIGDKFKLCEMIDSLTHDAANNVVNNCENLGDEGEKYDEIAEVYCDDFKDQVDFDDCFEDDDETDNYTDSDEDYEDEEFDEDDNSEYTDEYESEHEEHAKECPHVKIKVISMARNKYLLNSHLQFIDDYLTAYSNGEHEEYIKSILDSQQLNSIGSDTLNEEIIDYLNAYNVYQGKTDTEFINKFNDAEISDVFIESILCINNKTYKNIEIDNTINMCNVRHVIFEHEDIRVKTIINSTHPSIVVKQKNMNKPVNKYNLLNRNELSNKVIKSIIEEINDGIKFTARILKRSLFKYELFESHEKYIDELVNVLRSYNYDVSIDVSCSTTRHQITYIQIEW